MKVHTLVTHFVTHDGLRLGLNRVSATEGEGLEPPRDCSRRISRALPPRTVRYVGARYAPSSPLSTGHKPGFIPLRYARTRYACNPGCNPCAPGAGALAGAAESIIIVLRKTIIPARHSRAGALAGGRP